MLKTVILYWSEASTPKKKEVHTGNLGEEDYEKKVITQYVRKAIGG